MWLLILLVVVIAASCNCIHSQEKSKTSHTSNSKSLPNVKTFWPSVLRSTLPRIFSTWLSRTSRLNFCSAFSISRVLYSKISCIHHNLRLQLRDLQRFRHRNLEPEFVGVTSNKTSAFSTDVLMCAQTALYHNQFLRNIRRYLARKENCLPLWKIHMPKKQSKFVNIFIWSGSLDIHHTGNLQTRMVL